jgi:uncharacterized membrane protein
MLPNGEGAAHARWLLVGSLAINLCFVGAAGAMALRYSSTAPLSTVARFHHSGAERLDHLAAILPSNDAQVMRSELRADEEKVAIVQADLRLAEEDFRNSLRAEPFNLDAVRAAMATDRAARESFDLVLHDVIAAAAAKMSVAGRNKLAEWPASRNDTPLLQ